MKIQAATTLAMLSHIMNNYADAACVIEGIDATTCESTLQAAINGNADCAAEVGTVDTATVCASGYPFVKARDRGYQEDKIYMDGGGELNTVPDSVESIESQAGRIGRFHTTISTNTKVDWPTYYELSGGNPDINGGEGYKESGYMSNFDLDKCTSNAVVCCFAADRVGTVSPDRVLTDNADICSHELNDSADSNHIVYGWAAYEGAETDTYCQGFMWEDGEDSDTYKANALFEASYHTTFKHGFTRNIEGAPMCGCVETMPVISDAACLEASATGTAATYDFEYVDGYGLVKKRTAGVTVSVGPCSEETLSVKYEASGLSDDQKKAFKKKVLGLKDCGDEETNFLNEKFYVPGKKASVAPEPQEDWTQFVGERSYLMYMPGETEFRRMYDEDSETGIIYRYCRDCTDNSNGDYKHLYYRRLGDNKAFPEEFAPGERYEALDMFMNSFIGGQGTPNEIGVTFGIWNTLEDALNKNVTASWTFCGYDDNNEGLGFPARCGPAENQRDGGNFNSYDPRQRGGRANHHAFFLHTKKTT